MRYDTPELESADAAGLSLEACDDAQGPSPHASDPAAHIMLFCHLMAGQGWEVSPALMRVDREYAMWQLARARAGDDAELRILATQLFAWFDEAQAHRR